VEKKQITQNFVLYRVQSKHREEILQRKIKKDHAISVDRYLIILQKIKDSVVDHARQRLIITGSQEKTKQ
jgi:hypothetical protein